MRTKTRLQGSWLLMGVVLALLGCCWVTEASAQISPYSGFNAVCYNSSGTAPDCSTQTHSPAFIDASVFNPGAGGDVCKQIRSAFATLSPGTAGVVIDARGVTGSGNTLACANGTPWFDRTTGQFYTTSAEILLPAGLINVSQTWVLPSGTRVKGAGVYGVPGASAGNGGTVLVACTFNASGCNLSSSNNVIVQFGDNGTNYCVGSCAGISVEDLTVSGGSGQALIGILNEYAQNGSYVNQVTINNVAGSSAIGLQIGGSAGSAVNSGPYSNLYFVGGDASTCVEFYPSGSGTLGLHGITCTGSGSMPAIYLDASNTTIEDAHIEDSKEGVRVGGLPSGVTASAVASDTLINISAGGGSALTDLVHICGGNPPSTGFGGDGGCPEYGDVSGLTLIGLANVQPGGQDAAAAVNNIQDDQTSTLTPSDSTGNRYGVGLYGAGDQFGCTECYTRFSTSPYTISTPPNPVPAWGVGYGVPGGTCPVGSIFSNTQGTNSCGSGANVCTLYVCYQTTSGSAWKGIL
jgi:hypothetical protein